MLQPCCASSSHKLREPLPRDRPHARDSVAHPGFWLGLPSADEDLAQMPPPLRAPPHRFRPTLTDLVSEVGTETTDPEADAFVADVDIALVENFLDIPKRKRKSNLRKHAKLDDPGTGFEVAKLVSEHFQTTMARIRHIQSVCTNNPPTLAWPTLAAGSTPSTEHVGRHASHSNRASSLVRADRATP